jgi:hypothetical protein
MREERKRCKNQQAVKMGETIKVSSREQDETLEEG